MQTRLAAELLHATRFNTRRFLRHMLSRTANTELGPPRLPRSAQLTNWVAITPALRFSPNPLGLLRPAAPAEEAWGGDSCNSCC